nr:hypothetical protein [Tanacetum cinerariifolium]
MWRQNVAPLSNNREGPRATHHLRAEVDKDVGTCSRVLE